MTSFAPPGRGPRTGRATLTDRLTLTDKDRELLEILGGVRPKGRDKAAVRFSDISGLMQIPEMMRSAKAAGSTPTKAEFDALVADVHDLHRILLFVAHNLQRTNRS